MTVTLNPEARTQIESFGLNQRKLAQALDVSPTMVSRWYNGMGISAAHALGLLELIQQHLPNATINDVIVKVED